MTVEVRVEARDIARMYQGRFAFMLAMKARALHDLTWMPTQNQALAILKSTKGNAWLARRYG